MPDGFELEHVLHLYDGKVDMRLPGKGNSNSHGARPVHQIISMIKWIRTSRLSIQNSLLDRKVPNGLEIEHVLRLQDSMDESDEADKILVRPSLY